MTQECLQFIRENNTFTRTSVPNHTSHRKDMKCAIIKSIRNTESLTKSIPKYRIRLAVVILIIQWPFKRFHFRYRDLKVLTEVVFLTCKGREFQMAAPEYIHDL